MKKHSVVVFFVSFVLLVLFVCPIFSSLVSSSKQKNSDLDKKGQEREQARAAARQQQQQHQDSNAQKRASTNSKVPPKLLAPIFGIDLGTDWLKVHTRLPSLTLPPSADLHSFHLSFFAIFALPPFCFCSLHLNDRWL